MKPRIANAAQRLIECPICCALGIVDEDQWHGLVSIQCPEDGCTYHETYDLSVIVPTEGSTQ